MAKARLALIPPLFLLSLPALAVSIDKPIKLTNPERREVVGIMALSDDGKIAFSYGGKILSGDNWNTITESNHQGTYATYEQGMSRDGAVVSVKRRNYQTGVSQLVLLSGDNWKDETVIYTTTINSDYHTGIVALNSDGTIIAGATQEPRANIHDEEGVATIWKKTPENQWVKTLPGTARSADSSAVLALSADGRVAAGYLGLKTRATTNNTRPVLWFGENWQKEVILDQPAKKFPWSSLGTGVNALNGDGSIAGGAAMFEVENTVGGYYDTFPSAVIWHGQNWGEVTELPQLKGEPHSSSVNALSLDGRIAVGYSRVYSEGRSDTRAVAWYGDNWSQIIDLGTLASDNSGESVAYSINADGTIIGGVASSDDRRDHDVIWRAAFPKAISPENSLRTLNTLANDTFALLSSRKHAVRRLTADCQAGNGQFCYSAGYDYQHATQRTRSHSANLLFGYGIADNLTAGFGVSTPLAAKLNDTHRVKSGVGVGVFARFHGTLENGRWYLTPAVAFDTQKLRVNRPHLMGTEEANNRTKVTGTAFSLTFGQDFGDAEKFLGWYSALRHEKVKRHAYTEDVPAFPFVYDAAKLSETTFALGVKGSLPMTAHLTWESSAEFEQRIGGGKAHFAANAEGLASVENTERTRGFRPSVQTGFGYAFSPATKVSVGGYVSRAAFNGTDKGAFLKVSGTF